MLGAKKRPLVETVRLALEGGADVVQLRDKNAKDDELVHLAQSLMQVTNAFHVPLIINDRIEVAKRCKAQGLHLGQDDASLREARAVLGSDCLYGRSTHSPEQAKLAEAEGFDYIGVGPVFSTPTKPDYSAVGLSLVSLAAAERNIPFVAIGGIDETNAVKVKEVGARTIAVVRAVMASADPKHAAQKLKEIMK